MVDLGAVAELEFVAGVNHTLVDPTNVVVTVGLPDGTTVTLAPTRVELGRYEVAYPTTQVGRHTIRWLATGPGIARTDVVNVVGPPSAALASLADLKQHLNITGTDDDEELRAHLDAATAVVERHTGQTVARRAVTERHIVPGVGPRAGRLFLQRHPVIALTAAVSVDGLVTWDVGALIVDPDTGAVDSGTGPLLYGDVDISYVSGMAATPPHYALAALIIAGHLFQTQRLQTLGAAPAFGPEQSPSLGGLGYAIPNRAAELLGGRPPVIA